LKKILRWFAIIVIAIPIVSFAVANRHLVTFSVDPLSQSDPFYSIRLPLFALLLGFMLIGILIGGTASWLNQRKWRKAAREARNDAAQWHDEARRLRDRAAQPPPFDEHAVRPDRLPPSLTS